ncbi:hypothetical protein OPIT5_04550 [Opitutaceae bacterium TAV5]|nr:hypothetical protein OPIT5_04550 [Opitutaceae bacterium TAV5]
MLLGIVNADLQPRLAGAEMAGFQISDVGRIERDGVRFEVVYFNPKWNRSTPSFKTLRLSSDGSHQNSTEAVYDGTWMIREDASFAFVERIRTDGQSAIDYSLNLASGNGVAGAGVSLVAMLPIERFYGRSLIVDGTPRSFYGKYNPDQKSWSGPARKIIIPLDNGELTVTGDIVYQFQDNRGYNRNNWELRFWLKGSRSSVVRDASLDLRFSYTAYRHHPVSIAQVANMGFADEKADDGAGGWTDQGPDNDLRMFPAGRHVLGGIPFEITNPDRNDGKACVVLQGKSRSYFPKQKVITLDRPVAGKYLYLLHAVAWEEVGKKAGTLSVQSASEADYVDKEILSYDIVAGRDVANFWNPRKIPHGVVAWTGRNPNAIVGIYLTRIELSGKPVSEITLESAGGSVWMVAGLTLSDKLAGEAPPDETIVLEAGEDYAPVSGPRQVKKGSILDLSGLLDAPAGKHGFLRSVGEHFEFEKRPGLPVRFWGGNFVGLPGNHETTDANLDAFAAMGYNLIRLHHFDGYLADAKTSSSLNFNATNLDKLDYFIAGCKKRGIYITLDLYTMRRPARGELPGYADRDINPGEYKMLTLMDDGVMANFREFSKRLLDHVNPYTGLAWKDDPAISFVSLLNENTIYALYQCTPFIKGLFEKRFSDYVSRHDILLTKENRISHERRFLHDTYASAFIRLREMCKDIGIRVPITDQNFWLNLATTLQREEYDYADVHFYWKHPVGLGSNPYGLPARIESTSAITEYGGTLLRCASARVYGRPFTVSEWDFVAPSSFNTEGSLLVGAFAAAQDWSGLMRFCYYKSYAIGDYENSKLGSFSPGQDPQTGLSERAGVLLFLRGDLGASVVNYPLLLPRNHLDVGGQDETPRLADRLGLLGKTGVLIVDPDKTAILPPATKAAITLGAVKTPQGVPVYAEQTFSGALNLERKVFSNDTGEITMNVEKNTFAAVNPRSEGFVLAEGQQSEGSFVSVQSLRSFATVFVAAMDGQPLATSSRYLILHLTDTKGTGMRFRDKEMTFIEDWGQSPLLVRRGQVKFRFNRNLEGFVLYALDLAGERLFPVEIKSQGSKSVFTATNTADGHIVAAYELIYRD